MYLSDMPRRLTEQLQCAHLRTLASSNQKRRRSDRLPHRPPHNQLFRRQRRSTDILTSDLGVRPRQWACLLEPAGPDASRPGSTCVVSTRKCLCHIHLRMHLSRIHSCIQCFDQHNHHPADDFLCHALFTAHVQRSQREIPCQKPMVSLTGLAGMDVQRDCCHIRHYRSCLL